jgi:hypothetical protein
MATRKAPKDTRLSCPFCGSKTWSGDHKSFMRDHDRPDGRRCLQASEQTTGSQTPNRALTRFQLERLALQAGGASRSDISRMTDAELRRYVGNDSLLEAGDMKKNATRRREEADVIAARELSLYIENEYSLVGAPNSQGKAIEKNLLAKIRKGTFDLEKSELAWMYLMEAGAKKYAKEYASASDWSKLFNKPTRELVAHEFATTFYEEHKLARNGENRSIGTEDGDYVITGMYSDGSVTMEFGFDGDEKEAIAEARRWLRSSTFEGDSVRVITRDGELVFQS